MVTHEKLTDALSIRFHESTRKLLERRAALEQRKPSDWVRRLVINKLQPEKAEK